MRGEEKPVATFTLSIVGVAFQVAAGIFWTYTLFFYLSWDQTWFMHPWMMGGFFTTWSYGWSILWTSLIVVIVALGVFGTFLMNNSDPYRVRAGSTLVLVAAILAFPTMWGFMVGSLLMFIGSILGLVWQPMRRR